MVNSGITRLILNEILRSKKEFKANVSYQFKLLQYYVKNDVVSHGKMCELTIQSIYNDSNCFLSIILEYLFHII